LQFYFTWKDLANIVGDQQEDIDTIENSTVDSCMKAKAGLAQVEKANASQNPCVVS